MPNNALKARWDVQAGVVPGFAREDLTRRWYYSSAECEEDENGGARSPAYHSIFAKRRAEAMDYYLIVSMPQRNNWATITFVWF
jgi:hypothetical protein